MKAENKSSHFVRTPPRTPRKRATRAKICNAARHLFFEQGFEGTTVEQIAAEAGTRRSTLYTHFRDKDEILAALMDDFLAAVREMIARLPAFRESLQSDIGLIRAQAVLRQLGWSFAQYADAPESGDDHLTVAAEWLEHFLAQSTAESAEDGS